MPSPFDGIWPLSAMLFARACQLVLETLTMNSSSILFSSENATRTGYSLSETSTPLMPSTAGRAWTCAVNWFSWIDWRCVGDVRSATVCVSGETHLGHERHHVLHRAALDPREGVQVPRAQQRDRRLSRLGRKDEHRNCVRCATYTASCGQSSTYMVRNVDNP